MRQHKIIADRKKLLDCVVKETGLNSAFFAALLAIKEGEKQLLPEDAVACMESYIDEMARFSAWIDTLDAESKNDRTDHVTFR